MIKKREAISKTIRFEIFKRDKFTCQYCGKKAPDVVLNIDHINPVAKGGTNELMNLITSCFDCNNGKRDKKLDDSSVVEKQRKQLELLQERREQIELMLEWKKSLSDFDNDVVEMLVDYINSKIAPLSLNENGKQRIVKWLKKFSTEQILDAIDISAKQYLQYENGEIEKTSAEIFLKKIGGVMTVQKMPPIKQKLAYIKGIARNRFSYFDEKTSSIILENYVKELEKHYDENQLLEDLETEVSKVTKEAKNWTEWKNTLEKWTSDIQNWEKPKQTKSNPIGDKNYSLEELENLVDIDINVQKRYVKLISHIAQLLPDFDEKTFKNILNNDVINFLKYHNDFDSSLTDYCEASDYVGIHISDTNVLKYFTDRIYNGDCLFCKDDDGSDEMYRKYYFTVYESIEQIITSLLVDIFMHYYYPLNSDRIKVECLKTKVEISIKKLQQII